MEQNLGENAEPVLYALVMSDGRLLRDVLPQVLPEKEEGKRRKDDGAAVRNALLKLGEKLELKFRGGKSSWVELPRQERLSVDLWSFLDLVEEGRCKEAAELDPKEAKPATLPGLDQAHHWQETLTRLEEAREEVRSALEPETALRVWMENVAEELLDRTVSPGVGRQVPIREVHEKLAELPFLWQQLPEGGPATSKGPLSHHLWELLVDPVGPRRRLIVTGGSGMGKTLTGKLTYLRLFESPVYGLRPVLYLDATAEASQDEFAEDGWLERRLREMGAPEGQRAVVIMVHADSLFSTYESDLSEILGRNLFHDHDVLLCCSEQLYSKGLRHEEYATHVFKLQHWDEDMQGEFAEIMYDKGTRVSFERWREDDLRGTREELCAVPLHLTFVLPFIEQESEALARISTPWHLFDQVARVRLERARLTGPAQHARFEELAGLAHRSYVAGEHADRPIGFSHGELRHFLVKRDPEGVDERIGQLLDRTLLCPPEPTSDEIHFEESSWGWFFAAWHLWQALIQPEPPERPLQAFAKFFSLEVMELCKEMLRESMPRHEQQILGALRHALFEDPGADLEADPRSIAREQVAYLLAILGGLRVRDELLGLLDPESESWELDPLVRRGAVIGLANGGDGGVADTYVESLRAEREATGPNPERDANIAFLLSFHGVRRFDASLLGRDAVGVDPSPTVAELIRGLEAEWHHGSWRIKLFTLIDLGRHPAIAPGPYRKAIAVDRGRLQLILERREADQVTAHWPELAELRELLDA